MLKLFIVLVLFIVLLITIALGRAYRQLPPVELKRRARADDRMAVKLYRAAVYENELYLILWFIGGLSAAGLAFVLARSLWPWLGFLILVALIWLSPAWGRLINLPLANYLAKVVAPPLSKVLGTLHPVLNKIANQIDRFTPSASPNKLYQIEDLRELIHHQEAQTDNRIPKERLDMASRSLTFGDITVNDIMIPRRMIVSVNVEDKIGPHLMDELHGSGHSRFPVFDGKKDNIVGTLYLKDVIDSRQAGSVKTVMKKVVYYVHDEYSLEQTLHAFLKTKHHLFIVIDEFEELVGLVTIEDVLEQIIGRQIVDEFDQYEDIRAVAKHRAGEEHATNPTEMIE